MEVFTNLFGPIAPILNNYISSETKQFIDTVDDNKTVTNNNQQYLNFLNNLSTEEINAIVKKYITFDNSDPTQKIAQSFLILLAIPCVTMFFVLIAQHIGICLKILVGFLTILHVIIITYYLREKFKSNTKIDTKYFENKDLFSKAIKN